MTSTRIFFGFVFTFLLFITSLTYASFNISGLNEAQYTYKSAQDSLSNYFYNETSLRMNYNNIEVGLSFIAELPEYDQFQPIQDLRPGDVDYRWDARYLQANLSNLRLRAGTFTEHFGAGIMLRSYRDRAYDHDTRLSGLNIRADMNPFRLKALYGALPNENYPDRDDVIGGLDFSSLLFGAGQIGFSFTSQQIARFDNRYRTRLAAGSRLEIIATGYDIYAEYAESKTYRTIGDEIRGHAIYGFGNTYIGLFTFSGGYKFYDRFEDRMNDLPTLNSSEEPLSERQLPGYGEEGLLGQIRFTPDLFTELAVAYSEAWNSDYSLRQSDLFVEGRKDFDTFVLGLEYAQLELIDKEWQTWSKEITPAILLDFDLLSLPAHLRTEFGYHERVTGQTSREFFNPLIQIDLFWSNYSISMISEFELEDLNEPGDSKSWIGLELLATPVRHTDIRLFIGQERGGKVCRSGVCYYTTPFEGLRLELTTRF